MTREQEAGTDPHMSRLVPGRDQSSDTGDIPTGNFSTWTTEIRRALRGEQGSDVPCGSCTACCTSSQFIHIEPDETGTLAHVPATLLFPAPDQPRGNVLLGYDERGHCPMLVDDRCSIYEHRPRTCRTYDCRVFPAAGIAVDDDRKELIDRQARRWRFGYPTPDDRTRHDAVRSAAIYVRDHGDSFPHDDVPTSSTQLAVLAVEIHDCFLDIDADTGRTTVIDPDPEAVRVALRRRTAT
jgi:Fe-S-cluster containining protein